MFLAPATSLLYGYFSSPAWPYPIPTQ
jgi:hypothetical protein